ncbi:MAG: VOC family protein [Prochlorothrix sp.]
MHHLSIRTANIHRAIAFYEALGFHVQERFTTGFTLACWMEGWGSAAPGETLAQAPGLSGRLELIQIPQPRPVPDAFGDEHYTGFYHASFDVTALAPNLPQWLEILEQRLQQVDCDPPLTLKVLLPPTQQMIGDRVYEVAFIADGDGLPLEFLHSPPPVSLSR